MILYHGTTYLDYLKIKEKIKVDVNFCDNKELDFGYGFYLSKYPYYAKRIAKVRYFSAKRITTNEANRPVILKCEVDVDSIRNEAKNKIIIKHKNMFFLKTVFTCRYYKAGVDTLQVDYVEAPLADGIALDSVMEKYRNNPTTINKLHCYASYMLPVFTRQYIIKAESLTKYITSISPIEI